MKKALALLLLGVSTLCAQSVTQQPSAKEALLIANGDYAHFGRLPNPVNDARLLALSLQKVGFQVTLLENQSREGMLDALNVFQDRLKATRGIALFHYGGHGVQVSGRNYLIPVDADIPDERKVSTRAVDMEEVMTSLDASGSQVNVVVLDACRDNPLPATSSRSASRGLSVVHTKPKNSLIVYAAEPGSKAEDGLFTPTLAEVITTPGKSLSQIFKDVRRQVFQKSNGNQTPGEYDQLFEDVYLAGGSSAIPPSPQEVAQPVPVPRPSIQTMVAVAPRSTSGGMVQSVDRPNLGPQFVNSLGQRFVPIPSTPTYFCIWSTRVSDYGQFVRETGRFWKPAGFPQKPDHAAVRISWEDATAFCEWVTQKEHAMGKLPANLEYRLPKDLEWSAAVGITGEMEGQPSWRDGGIPNCFAWGTTWPPPPGVGNLDPKMKTDPYPYTSPVGSFAPNRFGLYDMCGNVLQWCQEDFDESGQGFLRGSSWPDEEPDGLNLTTRHNNLKSTAYKCYGFRCVIAPIAQK
jgi:formylglycine-generating enzyme required for sulfatase activity